MKTPVIPVEYREFSALFKPMDGSDPLPPHRPGFDFEINLQPNTSPPFGRIYNLSPPEKSYLKNHLNELQSRGFITLSKSSAGAPVLFVAKKDGSLRMVIDYRGLNAITIKNKTPLPLIDFLFTSLHGSTIFTKLDLSEAYHHIRIKEGDQWKTAFRTPMGLFEWQVMPFGASNASGTFQAWINHVLREYIDVFVFVYQDDVLIYSPDADTHTRHVRLVLSALLAAGVHVKLIKCEFSVPALEFIGYQISSTGFGITAEKSQSFLSWGTPKNLKQLQSFLGFSNFHRRFIRNYSSNAAPLFRLLKKDIRFSWSEDCDPAFQTLLKSLSSSLY